MNEIAKRLRATVTLDDAGDALLDEAANAIERLAKELAEAVEALQRLVDWQNGPPLLTPKWADGWGGAMDRAQAVLAKSRDASVVMHDLMQAAASAKEKP